MNHRKGTHHRSHLVALQPPDEMPLQGQVRQLLLLGQRLLQPALAKGSLTAGRQLTNRLGGVPLADGQQLCRGRQRRLQSGPAIREGPGKAQPSDEGLIKQLPPILQFLGAGALAALQIDIGMMTGIAVGNHLELGSTGLQGH